MVTALTDPVPESLGGQEGPLLGPLPCCKRPRGKQHALVRKNQGFVRAPHTCRRSVGGSQGRVGAVTQEKLGGVTDTKEEGHADGLACKGQ